MEQKKVKWSLIYVRLAICLFCSCNLDYAPSTISPSIADSKEKGFFLSEYKVDSLVVWDKKKSFVVKKVWIEKAHTSTMTALGRESYQTNGNFFQVVFDLGKDSYFTSDNFLNCWIISDEKGDLGGSEGRMINVGLSDKENPTAIRFKIYYLKTPGVFNYDTVKVAEFLLKKS